MGLIAVASNPLSSHAALRALRPNLIEAVRCSARNVAHCVGSLRIISGRWAEEADEPGHANTLPLQHCFRGAARILRDRCRK